MENHGIVALLMLLFYRVEQSYPVIVLLRLLDPFSCCSMGYSYQSVRFFFKNLFYFTFISLFRIKVRFGGSGVFEGCSASLNTWRDRYISKKWKDMFLKWNRQDDPEAFSQYK